MSLMVRRKDAELRPPLELFPWTAAACALYSVFAAAFLAAAYRGGGISEPWAHGADTQTIRYHAGTAVMLVFSAFVLECGFLWTGLIFGKAKDSELSGRIANHRVMDSLLTLFEYGLKLASGMAIWKLPGLVHTDIWAVGGPRPVYFLRFAQWAVAVPVLILISNRPFLAELGFRATLLRSLPSLVAVFFSVWLAWMMEVTTVYEWRWPCMVVSGIAFVLAEVDQLRLCWQCRHLQLHGMKMCMVIYQVLTFVFYTVVFMLGRFGLVGLHLEQYIYAYCDSTVKVLQGAILALIRGCEDAHAIHLWYAEAVAYKKDFDTILKLAHVPILAIERDCKISRVNEAASELLGITDEGEVIGKSIQDLLTKGSKEALNRALEKIELDKWRNCSGLLEVAFRHLSTEREVCLLLNLVPVDIEDGVAKSIVAIGQDLTELAELKSVEEKKSRLMAVVSHELRSPLHGMIGLTTGMMEVVKTEGLKRQLGMVRSCAVRLLDLVTNIMDLSESDKRKKAGAAPQKPKQKVDFTSIVDEIIVMSRHAVDKANKPLIKSGVELRNMIRDMGRVPIVLGSPYKCTQLVYNLVTNACKFTKQGSVSVCGKHLKEKGILEISVVDTGCGISAEARNRIFKPFEQEHSSSGDSRNFQGMGLGLAVCMEIVEQHKGSIRVESEMGKGSSFIISLACQNDEFCDDVCEVPQTVARLGTHAPENFVEKQAPKSALAKPRRERPMILSVDDDEVNQEVIRSVLDQEFEVVCCMSGPSALAWLERQHRKKDTLPDVVLLDIQMPGMTGYEVCKKIRQHMEDRVSAVPVMMLSANVSKISAMKCAESGSTDFLPKPFEKELLLKKVRDAIGPAAEDTERMPRQSTEDLSMGVLGAREKLLEAEKKELQESAHRDQERIQELEKELRKKAQELAQLRLQQHEQAEAAGALRSSAPGDSSEKSPLRGEPSQQTPLAEVEFLYSELAQRDLDIVRLQSQLGMCKASNQLISRRLHMQNRMNQILHDVLTDADTPELRAEFETVANG